MRAPIYSSWVHDHYRQRGYVSTYEAAVDAADNYPAPTDPNFAYLVSGLHFDGADGSSTFTDIKSKTWTTGGSPTISTTRSKFGGASGRFNGSYITTGYHVDFNFGTGDFCIRGWVNWNGLSSYASLYDYGYTAANALLMQTGNGDGKFIVYINGAAKATETTGTVNLNQWYYMEFARSGGTLKIFRDGVQTASVSDSTNITQASGGVFYGVDSGSHAGPDFYLDDWRVYKGYGGNTSGYTPPVAAFPDS